MHEGMKIFHASFAEIIFLISAIFDIRIAISDEFSRLQPSPCAGFERIFLPASITDLDDFLAHS